MKRIDWNMGLKKRRDVRWPEIGDVWSLDASSGKVYLYIHAFGSEKHNIMKVTSDFACHYPTVKDFASWAYNKNQYKSREIALIMRGELLHEAG